MVEQINPFDPENIAARVVAALDDRRQIPTFSTASTGLALHNAYRVTPFVRSTFEARGEAITGRKIGFSNRDLWPVYGVQTPIWGYCTDRRTHALQDVPVQSLADFLEPRIEPEIMFGLNMAPSPGMDEAALLDCIEWLSLGYEVVQSIYPDWKFTAADTIAANALHGALFIGPRHPIAPRKAAWQHELASFGAELFCDGKDSQAGGGSRVLGSPLLSLQHLVDMLADDAHNPPLAAGEIISTGTLTQAMPVRPGEAWTTRVEGIALHGITLEFSA